MTPEQIALATAGGLVGAVLNQAFTTLRALHNMRDEARYTALMLALQLEDYASDCTGPVSDLSDYASSSGGTREPTGQVPTLPPFSDKTNWRGIGMETAAEVMSFRVKVAAARAYVASTWEHDNAQAAWADASAKSIELGVAALQLSRRLRQAHKLPAMLPEALNVAEFLERKHQELKAQEAAWRARYEAGEELL